MLGHARVGVGMLVARGGGAEWSEAERQVLPSPPMLATHVVVAAV